MVLSTSFCCDSSFQCLHVSHGKGQREDLNGHKPPWSLKVKCGESVFLFFFSPNHNFNNKLNCLQFIQNVHNPKQWSPFHQQPSEVRSPSPLSVQTGTLTPLILGSTRPKLAVLCFRTSTTVCHQTTLSQVPCEYYWGNHTLLYYSAQQGLD